VTPAGPTGFLGLSHLGIVSGIGWASFGEPVLAVDPDAAVVGRLNAGDLPVREPGLPELRARSRERLTFTADLGRLGECPLVIVARDVPTDADNRSDLGPVLALLDAAVPHLHQGVVLALMSQVPPGFTRELDLRIRAARPDLAFTLYYWVETLIFGDAVRRVLQPERLIVGCEDPAAPLPPVLQAGLARFGCPILQIGYESAELTKTAINLYLIGAVTYSNTLADLCEAIGADWAEIAPALRLDARIGPAAYLRPSLGIAGGNLERDLVTLGRLAAARGVAAPYLDALATANADRFGWVGRKLEEHVFRHRARPTLGVWGLTYKKDTRSTKNSPALRLLADLQGRADVRAWDPAVGAADVQVAAEIVASREAVLPGADALLVMADWDDFAAADLDALRRAMRRPLVIDCVGVLEPRRHEMAGIEYISMGRRAG
jgi:UDPglucose 6-dehydrogenase